MQSTKIGRLITLAMLMQQAEAAQRSGGNGAQASAASVSRGKIATRDWDPDEFGNRVLFKFSDGETIELNCDELNDSMRQHLMLHGAAQKVGDSYAGVKGDVQQGKQNAQAVIQSLMAGNWEGEREGGGPRLAELAAAIARIKGVDEARARAAVEAASAEDREKWRGNAQVKAMVARIRAEKAAAALEAQGTNAQEVEINLG